MANFRKSKAVKISEEDAKNFPGRLEEGVKAKKIDALLLAAKNELKVYTETTTSSLYRILIEKMHEGAVAINQDGTILFCNSYFANMVKVSLHRAIGMAFSSIIEKTSKVQFDTLLEQPWEKGVKAEIAICDSEGVVIPVLISGNALQVHDKEIRSIILTDLTIPNKNREDLQNKSKQLEQKNKELENANEDLASITYVSSHDLQEPLRKIQNFVSIISKEGTECLTEKSRTYFNKVQETAKRMQTLLKDLLTYSSAKIGKGIFVNTDLNRIVKEVIEDLEELLREKRATIAAEQIGYANVIPFQFSQLVQNLITNSLKFSKPGVPPHIIIKSKLVPGKSIPIKGLLPEKNYLNITFSDNGIGFDPQYKDRIFGVFQRLHGVDEYQGTGIGLAICKRIVANHKGAMIATGEPGKGAQFDVFLPA